jgi:hypothetical protein
MAIEFHCQHCGHKVRTSSENAGKRGKCPSCHQSVYIPTPSDEIEPLHLAPLDEEDKRRQEELLEETRELTRSIRSDTSEVPEGPSPGSQSEDASDSRLPSDMETLVTEYVLAMSQGKLAEAELLADEIRKDIDRADEFLQRITMDELPPARLADIPRPVINGFIKQLRERQ